MKPQRTRYNECSCEALFQTIEFRAPFAARLRLEPSRPLAEWFAALDLADPFAGLLRREAGHPRDGGDRNRPRNTATCSGLARRQIRVMASRSLAGWSARICRRVVAGGRAGNARRATASQRRSACRDGAGKGRPAATRRSSSTATALRTVDHHLEGDVTIVGRVASGAEIVAGGSVHVYGALQGR